MPSAQKSALKLVQLARFVGKKGSSEVLSFGRIFLIDLQPSGAYP